MVDNVPVSLALLTQGATIPSTRFRLEQHLGSLQAAGFDSTFLHSAVGAYPPASAARRPAWLLSALTDSYRRVTLANQAAVCIVQRELVSTLATFERTIACPWLFDVDDAIFLNSRMNAAARIARHASSIICGNAFLADYFSSCGSVEVLPTAVDTDRFRPAANIIGRPAVIGWSGSSSGFHYLYQIESALARVLAERPESTLVIISDRPPRFTGLPADRVVFKRWTSDTEVSDMLNFSVGIMPLADGVWERGKCSFKMLTYMAVGIPVVVSPVGMNNEVLLRGRCGHSAKTDDEWIGALLYLLDDENAARAMGVIGRQVVEDHYSSKVIGDRLATIIARQR